jgi:hypothetical protein
MENWRLPTRGSVLIFRSHQPFDARSRAGIAEARKDVVRQIDGPPPGDGNPRLMFTAHDHEKDVAMYLDVAPPSAQELANGDVMAIGDNRDLERGRRRARRCGCGASGTHCGRSV